MSREARLGKLEQQIAPSAGGCATCGDPWPLRMQWSLKRPCPGCGTTLYRVQGGRVMTLDYQTGMQAAP